MSAMSNAYDDVVNDLHQVAKHLDREGHALAGRVHTIVAKLRGDIEADATVAKTDATTIAHDAATDLKPVVAEAEHDAATIATTTAADVAKDATGA